MKRMIAVGLALLPIIAGADITVNAPSQNGGWAYLFDPTDGSVYSSAQFSGGLATLDTGGMTLNADWAVDITYDAAKRWQSQVYWSQGSGSYGRALKWTASYDGTTINAVSGEITSRSYTGAAGSRSISVTYQGSSDSTTLSLENLNNDAQALDAMLRVYRPYAGGSDSIDKNQYWDPASLPAGYTYSTAAYGSGIDQITIQATDGSFVASYLGSASGAGYDIMFTVFDDPGDTAYWSSNDKFKDDRGVLNNGDDSVTFTAFSGSTAEMQETVPYYVMMDYSQAFKDENDPSEYLVRGRDGGISLTDPASYVIPEPAVASLLIGSGMMLLIGRRFLKR